MALSSGFLVFANGQLNIAFDLNTFSIVLAQFEQSFSTANVLLGGPFEKA